MTDVTLFQGDCLEYMRGMADKSVIVISDPPYGMNWNTDATRFSGGSSESQIKRGKGKDWQTIIHDDDKPFNPLPFLDFKKIILWGYHHFSNKLPTGSVLVWLKRKDVAFGSFLSDADLAWMKGGCGVYCFRDQSLMGETNNRLHPTQKPLPLMKWCIEKISQEGDTIFDPFMGSGTTGVAAVQLNRNFIGCEIDPAYFAIAEKRIKQAQLQLRLFSDAPKAEAVQADLL